MDETIGVKGGHNDRRRTLIISKKQKEKLKKYQEEKELKELEKEVKRKQKYTLIKTLPIVIVGQTIKELTKPKKQKEKFIIIEDETKIKETPETKKVIIVLKDGTKQIIEVPITLEIEEIKEEKQEEKPIKSIKEILPPKKEKEPVKEEKQEFIPVPETKQNSSIQYEDLTERQRNKLQKLQARKIIDIYEKQLKNIRYELRNLIIEYNTLIAEEDKIIQSKEEEKILDKLNEIIKKIEELKEKIRIDNLDKYDDNYIYTLVEDYLREFKDKKIIKEIKDSPLYILISNKLDEFDKKKEIFKDEVEEKKEELKEKEADLDKLKEKYQRIDKIKNQLNDFAREQELLLKEIQDKIDKAVTIKERVEVQVEGMNIHTRMLLRRLSLMMLIPGRRGAKALSLMYAIYANMARYMVNPKTVTKKYRDVIVYDYSKDIEKSINSIEDITNDLSKANKDIDKLITKIKEDFSEYIGVNKDCDELLSNLEKVKSNFKEKEYELEQIKLKQEKELERNNAKMLKKGTYPM